MYVNNIWNYNNEISIAPFSINKDIHILRCDESNKNADCTSNQSTKGHVLRISLFSLFRTEPKLISSIVR